MRPWELYNNHATGKVQQCDHVTLRPGSCDQGHGTMRAGSWDHGTRVMWPCDQGHVTMQPGSCDHATRVMWPCDQGHVTMRQESCDHATRVMWPCDEDSPTCNWRINRNCNTTKQHVRADQKTIQLTKYYVQIKAFRFSSPTKTSRALSQNMTNNTNATTSMQIQGHITLKQNHWSCTSS